MNKKGVSLLETIIATIIIALVMIGLVNIFIAGKRYIIHSRASMTAGELGKFFLEPLHEQVREDTWDASCLGTGNPSYCQNQIVGTDQGLDRNYTASYAVIPNFASTTLSKVTVNMTWNEISP
jgi:Tfp pilus assembly protein PilV